MLFTKQFIKSVSYPVTNCVNKTFNRKISTSSIRNEDLNMFTTTFKGCYIYCIINNIFIKINNIQKTLDRIEKDKK